MGPVGRPHRLMRRAAAALAIVGSLAGCSTPAPAAPPAAPAVPPGTGYVALGSSFAAGPDLPPVVDATCFRSGANYPSMVAEALDLDLADLSCAGARTEAVSVQGESVAPTTGLVTVTFGGNDVGYATALDGYGCLDTGLCAGADVDPATLAGELATVTDRMVTVLDAVRERAPDATLVLVGYPRILPEGGGTCPDLPLTAEHVAVVADIGERLDVAHRDAAERAGAVFVDAYSASPRGGVCEPDGAWVGGLPPGVAPSGSFPFHPTAGGMRAVADLVLAALAAP